MSGQTINAGVLQDATRDLLELLGRIHSLSPEQPLRADEVEGFTVQVDTMFLSPSANCVLSSHGCLINVPPIPVGKGPTKKTK